MPKPPIYAPGDWLRWMQCGSLVIGVVAYTREYRTPTKGQ